MIYILMICLFLPKLSWGDIFSKPSESPDLDHFLTQDVNNSYYRNGYEYSPYETTSHAYEFERQNTLGYSYYDFHRSLKNFIAKPDEDIDELMNKLSAPSSRLLFWQYSSPSVADLYKNLNTIGHLRLALRYQQYEDMEKAVNDPLVKLRKQAVLDCIRRDSNDDIEVSLSDCFDNLHNKGVEPFKELNEPGDGEDFIKGKINITERVLDRVNLDHQDVGAVKKITPRVFIDKNSVFVKAPQFRSRELINQYRDEFMGKLKGIVEEYRKTKTFKAQEAASLSVFGVPLTEGQIKNMAILDETAAYLAVNKVSFNLAYLKTIDQFLLASEMLGRVMSHPAIQPGYKLLLKSSLDYISTEIIVLREEKNRLNDYADAMRTILDQADQLRIKTIKSIRDKSQDSQEKGLFRLNP